VESGVEYRIAAGGPWWSGRESGTIQLNLAFMELPGNDRVAKALPVHPEIDIFRYKYQNLLIL
jgi:hypothetical protein